MGPCRCRLTFGVFIPVDIGGSKGGGHQGRLRGPNSFIFMQFSAKKLQNNPNLGVGAPPLGKILDRPLLDDSPRINTASLFWI